LVYNASGLDEEKLRTAMAEGQRALAAIPGVREVEVGSVADKGARYRYCWLIRFASAAVIDSYKQHPAHVAFADRLFRPAAADRLTTDYLIAGVKPGAMALPISDATTTPDTISTMAREII
ncbi:MAG: Dabb family protein, partial [Gallionella sp.]|nr:Dabb family protein [Gallionella sp.]